MPERLTGGCLCGAVRYVCDAPAKMTVKCYCGDCRRLGGTGHATHTVFSEDAFSLTGTVTEYEKTADSGRRINRRFCPVCGSALFHTRDGMEGARVRTHKIVLSGVNRAQRSKEKPAELCFRIGQRL